MKQNNNIDLGKYNFMQLLRNPGIIHKIQDSLTTIKGDGFLHEAIRTGARKNIKECITMIVSQYGDNPRLMTEIVGKPVLDMIEEFTGETLANDLKNVL